MDLTGFSRLVLAATFALVGRAGATQDHDHHDHDDDATAHHRFEDAEQWALFFEDPERDAWQLPDSVVSVLVDRDDLVIADIGSATGYFPVRFARAAPRGAVIGSDVEPDMVRYLNDRARDEGLENLVSVLAAADDPHLPRRVDLVFLCNTYHHIDDRLTYFQRLQAQMRPGGRVAVVDFRLESEKGPPHKLDPAIVEHELEAAGYRRQSRHEFLPEQYLLVYEVPGGE